MAEVIVTQPLVEPITVDEVVQAIQGDMDCDGNEFIARCIPAARHLCETLTWRSLALKTYRYSSDRFPGFHPQAGITDIYGHVDRMIRLYRPPVVSVTSVKYLDQDRQLVTLDPSGYHVDYDSEPCRIAPVGTWPATTNLPGSVQVTYTAGYNPENIPAVAKKAMCYLIGQWHDYRLAVSDQELFEMPLGVEFVLSPLRYTLVGG